MEIVKATKEMSSLVVLINILTIFASLTTTESGVPRISLCGKTVRKNTSFYGRNKTLYFKEAPHKISNIFSYANVTIISSKPFKASLLTKNSKAENTSSWLPNIFSKSNVGKVYRERFSCFENFSLNVEFGDSSGDNIITVVMSTKHFDEKSFLMFVVGLLLFINARWLSRSATFMYSSCASLGVVTSLIIVLIILFKLLPYKRSMTFLLFTGSGLWVYFVDQMKNSLWTFAMGYPYFVAGYFITSALVSVSLLYYFGLPSNHRSLNLLQWFMQLISIYVIYSSCYSKQFAVTVVTLLILFQFLSFKDLLKRIIYFVLPRKTLAWFYRPSGIRLLTMEEYQAQGIIETEKALKELSQYCSSPKCNSWEVVSKLKNPKRFASFLQTNEQFTAEELEGYYYAEEAVEKKSSNSSQEEISNSDGDLYLTRDESEIAEWMSDDEIERALSTKFLVE